jgi:hypothetical protein
MPTIDLAVLTGGKVRNLTGHERGSIARQRFGLDAMDEAGEPVDVQIPEGLEGITTSFFQGMFARSVRASGQDFLNLYRFHASPSVMEQIMRGIDRVNTKRGSALS